MDRREQQLGVGTLGMPMRGWPSLMVAVVTLSGLQLLMFGHRRRIPVAHLRGVR